MSDPITATTFLKGLTIAKTLWGWAHKAYRFLSKDTPEKRAISATAHDFAHVLNVKRALRKVLKDYPFDEALQRVREGGEFEVDQDKADLLIDKGEFATGLNTTPRDALKVLRAFERHYCEQLLWSPAGIQVADQRAVERQRETMKAIASLQPVPTTLSIELLQSKAREAASRVNAHWFRSVKLGQSEPIALRAIKLDANGQEGSLLHVGDLQSLIRAGHRMILEGPAGRGKTTTLLQIAQSAGPEELYVFIDLPAWIDSGKTILQFISDMPEFQAIGVSAIQLAQLSEKIHFGLLLNGWNEISDDGFRRAATQLKQLEIGFPSAGIILASRAVNVSAVLAEAVRIILLPLSNQERRRCIERVAPEHSDKLSEAIEANGLLDSLTRTPLFLSYVIAIFRAGGTISATRVGILREVVRLLETSDQQRVPLESAPLRGSAGEYLESLSIAMTQRGATRIQLDDARTVVNAVSNDLKQRGQIKIPPEPILILDELCKHHVLERSAYPSVAFRFQHQQFQEFYAARHLEQQLLNLLSGEQADARRHFTKQYINEPVWDEPLHMVAEEIGSLIRGPESDELTRAGALLVEMALNVDPILAADLARLCGESVWEVVGSHVAQRLRSLYESEDKNFRFSAVVGMIASGSPDFMEIVHPLLAGEREGTLRGAYRAVKEFHLTSLGEDWRSVVGRWTERGRTILIQELSLGESNTDLPAALEHFARTDPSKSVRNEAIKQLGWIGAERELESVLADADDGLFEEVFGDTMTESVPVSLRNRYLTITLQLLERSTDPVERLKLLLRAFELGDHGVSQKLKDELLTLPYDRIQDDVNEYILKPILKIINETDPEWVSNWVAGRFLDRTLSREDLLGFVSGISEELKTQVVANVCTEDLRPIEHRGAIELFRVVANPAMATAIFRKLLQVPRDAQYGGNGVLDRRRMRVNQLEGIFLSLRPEVAVAGLAPCFNAELDLAELTLILELLNRWPREPNDLRTQLPTAMRQTLRRFLKRAVAFVLAQDDFGGDLKATLASALARVGEPEDMQDLRRLILADIERLRSGRAARIRGERNAKSNGGSIIRAGVYVAAIMTLDRQSAEPLLLEVLVEPEYESDAASALLALATISNAPDPFKHPKDYGAIWKARSGSPQRRFDEACRQRYAKAIAERASFLRNEREQATHQTMFDFRLSEIIIPLASLDGPASTGPILDVIALAAKHNGWRAFAAIEALLFSGATLPTDATLQILHGTIESVREQSSYDNQATELLIKCLCLLPFLIDANVGVERMGELIAEMRLSRDQLREIVTALGQSRANEALALLSELAGADEQGVEGFTSEWINAVANLGGHEAEKILLSFIDPSAKEPVKIEVSTYGDLFASRLAEDGPGQFRAEGKDSHVIYHKACQRKTAIVLEGHKPDRNG